ncbi:WXG100 family type VII secretion target [Arthrobacter sp. R1-13]
MTGNLWGADVAQLRTLAQQFGQASESLQQQSTLLTSQINNNTSWKGNDALQFRSNWNGNHHALLQRAADRLKEESKKLLENANQQEKASDAAPGSGGGPLGSSGSGGSGWALPAVLGGVLMGGVGALRTGLTIQKFIKAPLTLAKHVGQYGWVLKNHRAEAAQALLSRGLHRLGGPVFDTRHLLQTTKGTAALEGLLSNSSKANRGIGIIDKATDLASLKNLHQYPGLSRLAPLLEEKPLIGAGTKLEWLGKSGLARGLGWAGVGFSAIDSVNAFANGDIKGGVGGALKAGLGVGCFLPPPAGTVCQVASVGVAIYENWDTISSVGKNIGEGIANAVQDPGKFVSDTKDNLVDAGKSVGKFFGIGD